MRRQESWKALALFLALYALVLLSLVSKLPLWLDEIVDLRGIRDYDFAQLIAWVPVNAGGVPLGYLTRFASIHLLGYSLFSARAPSALFSLLAAAGVFALARQLNLRRPLLASLFFALTPLQLRYALESRPYSLALALSVWLTAIFLRLLQQLTPLSVALYGMLTLLGLYTQPFMLFVPLAHLLWLFAARGFQNRLRLLGAIVLAIGLACLAFLPWYLWTTRVWAQSVAVQHLHYTISWNVAFLILHELVGAGYLGSALFLSAAFIGILHLHSASFRLFWLLYAFLPVILAVYADAVFGYFFAIRQILFVVAPLSLLAALALEKVSQKQPRMAVATGLALSSVLIVADVRFFLRPHENWQSAALTLQSLANSGSCISFQPSDTASLYEFFVPELAHSVCGNPLQTRSVAVAVSPYSEGNSVVLPTGFRKTKEFNREGPRVELYEH